MKRADLEHLIRASGMIVDCRTVVVLGSQAILASVEEPPAELTASLEADIYAPEAPERSDLISGSIGEYSPFHRTFGYFGDGVGPQTAVLPDGWEQRLVRLENPNTNGITALCLSPLDIAVSKLAAGRPKDMAYVRALFRHHIVDPNDVAASLKDVPDRYRDVVNERLRTACA